ncbi:unnamed protein product [Closterium sp. Yama58-4]|nr:unnamed protein product [Closterium sp. Yama58-4]
MLSGREKPRLGMDGPQERESDGVVEKEAGKRVADKETAKKAADKETGKAESNRGGKRQKGLAVLSVTDILKSKGGAVDLRAGTSNMDAWATVVGKEAVGEEPDVTVAQESLFAGAVTCAIAMVWETCNNLDLNGIADAGFVAALCAGTPEEKARGYPSIVLAIFKRARSESTRQHTTEVTPKQVAEAIESAVMNRLGGPLGDPSLVTMVAHEEVDMLMTWCDSKITAKLMEANRLYLALPEKCLSAKKRST